MEQTRTFTCIFKMVYYSWSKQQAAKQYMEQRMVMAIAWTREKRLPSVALTLTRLSLTLSRCNREPPWASTPTAAACRLRSDPAAQDISAPVPSHPRRPHRSSPPRLPEPRVPAAVTRAWPWRRQQELRPPPAMSSAGSCSPAPVPASSTPSSSSSEHELHRLPPPPCSVHRLLRQIRRGPAFPASSPPPGRRAAPPETSSAVALRVLSLLVYVRRRRARSPRFRSPPRPWATSTEPAFWDDLEEYTVGFGKCTSTCSRSSSSTSIQSRAAPHLHHRREQHRQDHARAQGLPEPRDPQPLRHTTPYQ
ncbi:serine/arginine repetitive matrix protein 1 isoform X6 [Triticum aestivum]|uniref:serine/arginine repetitive matrix protein 1 isoform X6 n=1 Tax=Triticum aestivum TaxID=4565 RepID=UPI001D01AA20|nr:serine/arginine repetitive matrix protein 1-like isoform X6 [Triticum aestivum]XP_044370930.1 serine/arginine repetitive matrix protein 1-like isoform X6 [Triticum aestivum]